MKQCQFEHITHVFMQLTVVVMTKVRIISLNVSGSADYSDVCQYLPLSRLQNINWRHQVSGVDVTKAPFIDFCIKNIFDLAKAHAKIFNSNPFLTDVTAAKLQRHLLNMNVTFHR